MHLAAELLRDYLAQNKITQSGFAKACKVDQSLVSKVIDGKIPISANNLSKLLVGIDCTDTTLRFLVAYLHDQIPTEYVHEIRIEPVKNATVEHVYGIDPNKVFDNAIGQVVAQLPTQTKSEVYQLIQALRVDSAIRSVFHGVMRYVPRPLWPEVPDATAADVPELGSDGAARLLQAEISASEQRAKDKRRAGRAKRKLNRLAPRGQAK